MSAKHAAPRRTTAVLFFAILVVGLSAAFVMAARPFHEPEGFPTDAVHFVPALWPEQWRPQLRVAQRRVDEGGSDWRLRPEETALRFVRFAMQWPRFHRLEVCDGEISPFCKRPGAHFAIARTAKEPPLIVSLDQLGRSGESGVWSVVSVQGPRVFLDIEPGQTVTAGEDHVARTTLPNRVDGYLRTGSSYTVPDGCGSGGGRVAKIEDGTITMRMSLDAVQCFSSESAFGAQISTGTRLNSDAVGFVFVAHDHEIDSIGYALDASMPRDVRDSFVGPKPILELAAVPVYFSTG